MTGSTWNRKQESALDHALTNKPEAIKNYFKIQIDYSDYNLICVDMKINVQKIQKNSTTARDYRKIRSNPQFFLKRLSRRNWNVLENMKKVDDMVILRTKETNDCLDECACVKFMNH